MVFEDLSVRKHQEKISDRIVLNGNAKGGQSGSPAFRPTDFHASEGEVVGVITSVFKDEIEFGLGTVRVACSPADGLRSLIKIHQRIATQIE